MIYPSQEPVPAYQHWQALYLASVSIINVLHYSLCMSIHFDTDSLISKYHNTPTLSLTTKSLLNMISSGLFYAAIFSFVVSLFFTVFFTTGKDISGFWVLITGWLGFVIFQFAWFANPLGLLAILILKKRPVVALILCTLAVALATMGFMFYEIPTLKGAEKIFIKEYGLGFYFWYAAQWLLLYSVILFVLDRGTKKAGHK